MAPRVDVTRTPPEHGDGPENDLDEQHKEKREPANIKDKGLPDPPMKKPDQNTVAEKNNEGKVRYA